MYNFQMIRYYKINSDIHSMNPLYKIICILLFSIMTIITNNIIMLLLLLIFVISLMILSNVPIKVYLKNIIFALSIIVFIIIFNIITNVSFVNTITSISKLLLFIMYSGILIYTTKPNDLTYGLEMFLQPLKIFKLSNSGIALTISLAIRFIPIIFMQANKVIKSQISRGLNFNGSITEKCNKIISIIVPIFTLSFERADSLSNVLEMRLYNENRNKYKKCKVTSIDDSILTMHILLMLILIILEVFL